MASVRVGSVFGIPVKLGASFVLVLPLLVYLIATQVAGVVEALNLAFGSTLDPAALTAGLTPWLLGTAAALGLFLGVGLHELGHSLVARRYGLEIESITLWFLGGVARFERFPDDWRQELAIAVAGPAVSVLLGGLFYASFRLLPVELSAARFVVGYLAVLNVALAAFNMLPGFPMDGGRVLRALLSVRFSRVRATSMAAAVGKGFAVLLALAGIALTQLFWVAIAFFIYLGATGEARQTTMEAAFEGIDVADVMTPAGELQTVGADATLEELVDRMLRQRHTGYPVLRDGDLVGVVTLEDVQGVDPERRAATTVGDVMTTDLATVAPDAPASDAITRIQRDGIGRLLVTDADGDLVGLVSRTDLMTVFQIVRSGRLGGDADEALDGPTHSTETDGRRATGQR